VATVFLCDRCGDEADDDSKNVGADVVLPAWVGDGALPPRDVPARVTVYVVPSHKHVDTEDLALCKACMFMATVYAMREMWRDICAIDAIQAEQLRAHVTLGEPLEPVTGPDPRD
jgi:hypothetical protein